MANRYWVGGTGTWDNTIGTKWSDTSGGTGGASVPTKNDDVFFDANSGSGTVTTSATGYLPGTGPRTKNLDLTGFTGTLNSNPINVSTFGSFIGNPAVTWSAG